MPVAGASQVIAMVPTVTRAARVLTLAGPTVARAVTVARVAGATLNAGSAPHRSSPTTRWTGALLN